MDLLKQNHVKYGLIMSGILILCLAWMELSGNNLTFVHDSPVFFAYQFILPAVVWFLGLRAKKKLQKGKLTFKQGVLESFKISYVFGISSALVFALYYLVVNPEIVQTVKEMYQMPNASNGMIITIDLTAQFIAAVVFGTLYGTVITLFVKSKKD